MGAAIALAADSTVSSRAKKRFLITGSFVLTSRQRSRDIPKETNFEHGGRPDRTDQCEVKRKQEWHKCVSWENGVVVYQTGGDCRRRYWRMQET